MATPEYFVSGYYMTGSSQFTPEKQGKDHFIVEDLLDFSKEEEDDNAVSGGDEGGLEAASVNSTDSSAVNSCNSSFPDGDPISVAAEICEPYDELAELEWLSNFVEDSFSSEDLKKFQLISGVQSPSEVTRVTIQSHAANTITTAEAAAATFFLPEPASVPGKARSKRPRAAPCNWSSRRRLSLSPSNSSATSSTSSSESNSGFALSPNNSTKTSKKKTKESGFAASPSDGRRCLHCATDRTPQWRTGPTGPKTLCNACGVRYKSGRLVPEYRPASSPTFVLSKHSNSHRKVLELRRHKEVIGGAASSYEGGSEAAGDAIMI